MFPPNMLSSNTFSWRVLGCHELNGARDGEKDEGVLDPGRRKHSHQPQLALHLFIRNLRIEY